MTRGTWINTAAVAGVMAAALLAAPLQAGDWPAWRGADRTGVSAETGLLQSWPPAGPPLVWEASGLGIGYSTPAIAAGRIYVLGGKNNREFALALDAKNGKQLWSTELGAVAKDGPPSYPGPRSTPTVDGNRLYVLGSDGDLACLESGDGKVVWKKNIDKEFSGGRGRWAYAESPLIDGDVLVCTPGGSQATLVALNKKDGALIWKSAIANVKPVDDPAGQDKAKGRGQGSPANTAAYASVIVANAGGIKQYVQFLGGGVVGVEASTGKPLWRFDKIVGITNCATPIFYEDSIFTSASSRDPKTGGGARVKLTARDKSVEAKEEYIAREMSNHHGGIVRIGDYLYGTNGSHLVCLDFKTGAVKWQERSVGKGSVTAADGHLYVRGEKGPIALVEANPAAYKEKGRFTPPKASGKPSWPHPVIADGKLYLRDDDVLLCFDIKQK